MSSQPDQNNQVYRQAHSFTTGINQIIDYYDNKIRALEQQVEALSKKNSELQPNLKKSKASN